MAAAQVLSRARQLANEVLFPSAMNVDASDRIPSEHFDALAAAGLYGLAGPAAADGLNVDPATFCNVIEIMAGGRLATTFVWLQHHGAVRALAASVNSVLAADWLSPLLAGARRAGVALGGARPGSPLLRARTRNRLDAADTASMPAARAVAAELAFRAAGAVAAGSRSIMVGHHSQRLATEALFPLVFGSRPAIKDHLTGMLTSPGG